MFAATGILLLIGPACGVGIPADESVLGFGFGKTSALEKAGCDPVSGHGDTAQENPGDPTSPFVGTATVRIRGDTFEDVAVTTILLGPPKEGDDGTLIAQTSHTFTVDDPEGSLQGSFTTTDKAVLEPTDTPGLFRLNSNMKITSGTGDFENAGGRLHGHGEIDLGMGEASFDINGVICFDGE
ncbi:MAG: hypothetical protein ACE5I3_07250 [Phycisphaerae bacterium]